MISKIELLIDGISQKVLDLGFIINSLPLGTHQIEVKTYKDNQLVTSKSKTITKYALQAPSTTGLVSSFTFTSTTGNLVDAVTKKSYPVAPSIIRNGQSFTIINDSTQPDNGALIFPSAPEFSFLENGEMVPFTVRLKFKTSAQGAKIMSKINGATGHEWQLLDNSGVRALQFFIYDNIGINNDGVQTWGRGDSSFSNGRLTELVITCDGKQHIRMYREGVQVDDVHVTAEYFGTMQDTGAPIKIGGMSRDIEMHLLQFYKGVEWSPRQVKDYYSFNTAT